MTENFTATRGRFAAAEAARAIVDEFATASTVRLLRSTSAAVLAAMLDAEDTPAVELIDEAVRFELINRASTNAGMRRRLDAYDEMIAPVDGFDVYGDEPDDIDLEARLESEGNR
jgi:hypothetical protein